MILTIYTATTMIIIAYLLGSIPSAVWIGKKYYGIDIREHGSKNAGTTNMLRVLGRRAALPVFALDFLKGFVAVTIIELMQYDDLIGQNDLINLKIVAVFAAVLGHIFPIFAGFRGGKGVATLVGAVTGIYPPVALLCFGYVCVKGRDRASACVLAAGLVAAVVIASSMNFDDIKHLFTYYINSGFDDHGRFDLWREALEKYLRAPVFGYGYAYKYDTVFANVYSPHNTLLQYLCISGIFGLVCYLLSLIHI